MNKKTIEAIAKVCHEANKAYCESIEDHSQQSWDYSSQEIRDSAFNGVLHILLNPSVTPEGMHENWLKEKIANGWVFGDQKDEFLKTHPCIRPYSELPEHQRKKDSIFSAIAKSMISEEKL